MMLIVDKKEKHNYTGDDNEKKSSPVCRMRGFLCACGDIAIH